MAAMPGRLVSRVCAVLAMTVTIVKRSDETTGFLVLPAGGSWNAPSAG
jgi:hypothetical protein